MTSRYIGNYSRVNPSRSLGSIYNTNFSRAGTSNRYNIFFRPTPTNSYENYEDSLWRAYSLGYPYYMPYPIYRRKVKYNPFDPYNLYNDPYDYYYY
ncbi:putative orfan [Tupanvirus soda lake]|uniref:Orfan n=2 Tax=Tupanvirus TaxID=2094720 RepID=A0AC62ADM7_9VIRU|nr:putative orfan [Tupanvirus soda lake]QKU35859.1 putative orfan [Tupanvirus soda lake]